MILDTALGPVNVLDHIPDGTKFYQIEATWPPATMIVRSDQIFGTLDKLQKELPKFLQLLDKQGYRPMEAQLRAVELDYMSG